MQFIRVYPLSAQESLERGIAVSPAIIEGVIKPGEKLKRKITIANSSDSPVPVIYEVSNPMVQDSTALPNEYNATEWTELSKEQAIIPAETSVTLSVTFSPPVGNSDGGRYTNITIRTLQLEQSDLSATSIIPEISVPVLLTVGDDLRELMSTNIVSAGPVMTTPGSDVESVITVANDGNIHNLVSTRFDISRRDSVVASETLRPAIVLPGTTRTFQITRRTPERRGVLSHQVELTYGSPKQLVTSSKVKTHNGPSLSSILATCLCTLFALFLARNHQNVKKAAAILFFKDIAHR